MKILVTIFIIMVVVAVGGLFISSKNSDQQPIEGSAKEGSSNNMINEANTRKSYDKFPGVLSSAELTKKKAVVKTTKGTIEFEILGQEAPKAASNFIFLSKEGFYDGLTFHRREENFVIQGGDPQGTGMGGPGYKFEDEPVKLDYKRGIVAMANSGPDTNGSQFFIMLADTNLPKKYTIFGKVLSGMAVVDKIQVGDKIEKITIESL
jgi:cyclophilin family peptidyl-prolyl cis-trans isomerase